MFDIKKKNYYVELTIVRVWYDYVKGLSNLGEKNYFRI